MGFLPHFLAFLKITCLLFISQITFFFFAEELGICLLFFYTCIQQNFKPLKDCFVDFVLPVPISLIIKCITQWFDDNDPEI